MEGGAENEEHAARGTNDMRTQYAMQIVVCLAAGLVLAGCGNLAKTTRPEGLVAASQVDPNLDLTITPPRASDLDNEQYDPWESFNEKMFTFNYNVDKYALKPVARGYRAVVPEQVQIMLGNALNNVTWVPRFMNSLLQGKWEGALREVSRFVLNSTLGIGGLFDPGKVAELQPSSEDFGQTLGLWGVSSGPYLVLPLLGPTTVRDGIGKGVDSAMNPLTYFVPFVGQVGMKVGDTVNDRALNYDLFAGVEATTIDLYSSVRHFYLKRREHMIEE